MAINQMSAQNDVINQFSSVLFKSLRRRTVKVSVIDKKVYKKGILFRLLIIFDYISFWDLF